MATSDGRDYFQRTRLFWMVTLSVALIYFACTVFAPDVVPFELLGPFGTFSKNFAYNHPDLLYKGDTARVIMDMRKFFQKQEPHSVQRGREERGGEERGEHEKYKSTIKYKIRKKQHVFILSFLPHCDE